MFLHLLLLSNVASFNGGTLMDGLQPQSNNALQPGHLLKLNVTAHKSAFENNLLQTLTPETAAEAETDSEDLLEISRQTTELLDIQTKLSGYTRPTKTYHWSGGTGMLGWEATNGQYANQVYNGDIHGLIPRDFAHSNRDGDFGKVVVTSPKFCHPNKITFKLQGGVSESSNAANYNYLGFVLVNDHNRVIKQQENSQNSHHFRNYQWTGLPTGCYTLQLRDGKNNQGWAHAELQDVIITFGPSPPVQVMGVWRWMGIMANWTKEVGTTTTMSTTEREEMSETISESLSTSVSGTVGIPYVPGASVTVSASMDEGWSRTRIKANEKTFGKDVSKVTTKGCYPLDGGEHFGNLWLFLYQGKHRNSEFYTEFPDTVCSWTAGLHQIPKCQPGCCNSNGLTGCQGPCHTGRDCGQTGRLTGPGADQLLASVNYNDKADSTFWATKCLDIPSWAKSVYVVMGTVIDYFKPAPGKTFCQMLTSNNAHKWSQGGAMHVWHTPAYHSGNLGGSAYQWPKNNIAGDNRNYLSFWGQTGNGGGCCHDSKNDAAAWHRSFKMFVSIV